MKHYALAISLLQSHTHLVPALSTYPSALEGVAAPDTDPDAVAKRPKLAADASSAFCSSASARRLRKSFDDSRPTVCDATRSAAVEA